jgi:two-component system LytT family response regulator
MIKVVIIEDETIYLDDLTQKLTKSFSEIKIIAKIISGKEALNILPKLSFNLLFLDIELGDMNAFELIEQLDKNDYHIIFVTAFESYALRAFKVNAID